MTPQDDRALIIAMTLFLISAGLQIATNRNQTKGETSADITAPVASSTIQPNQGPQ